VIERVSGAGEDANPIAPWVVAVAGCTILVARPFVGTAPDERALVFGIAYVAIAGASLAIPLARDRAPLSPAIVVTVGIALVFVAVLVAGTRVPTPWPAAALPMSTIAAIAEEALFRRIAYARLAPFGAFAAVVGSAVLFGLVHLPAYGVAAFPVDVGAGLLFGWQRWASGSWLSPAITHASANAVAIL
jgi:membrane protease YdiL (CAAX protease family)